jgi:hypothetical protein
MPLPTSATFIFDFFAAYPTRSRGATVAVRPTPDAAHPVLQEVVAHDRRIFTPLTPFSAARASFSKSAVFISCSACPRDGS